MRLYIIQLYVYSFLYQYAKIDLSRMPLWQDAMGLSNGSLIGGLGHCSAIHLLADVTCFSIQFLNHAKMGDPTSVGLILKTTISSTYDYICIQYTIWICIGYFLDCWLQTWRKEAIRLDCVGFGSELVSCQHVQILKPCRDSPCHPTAAICSYVRLLKQCQRHRLQEKDLQQKSV